MLNKNIKFICIFLFSLIFILVSVFLIIYQLKIRSLNIDKYYSGFVHYRIAKNIKDRYPDDYVNGINKWMLNNYVTKGINEHYLPVLDKNSLYRLIDGYSVCDGAAHTYIQISTFLNIKGYIIALFKEDNQTSPHTVTLLTPNKQHKDTIKNLRFTSVVIDPLFNMSFKLNNGYASLDNICFNKYNVNQKEYLNSFDYPFQKYFCNTKDIWLENKPINTLGFFWKITNSILDILPESLVFKIHSLYLNKRYDKNEYFLKARNYHLVGNIKQAKKYYNLTIQNFKPQKFDIFNGSHLDGNYKDKKNYNIELELEHYAKFFLILLKNEENNEIKKNPFTKLYSERNPFTKNYRSKIIIDRINPFHQLYENYYIQKKFYNQYIEIE